MALEELKGHENISCIIKILEVFVKSSKVAGMFTGIPVLTRQKSHAFDSKKLAGIL